MKKSRIKPEEIKLFSLFAFLFFINSLVLESNEVVATSGFISNVGISQILWVWAIVMVIVILSSGTYSIFVDKLDRRKLAISIFVIFSLVYLGFYYMFSIGVSEFVSYGMLAVVNEQQWMLFPLLIWAMANDLFSMSQTKRLFPILAFPAIVGGLVGNALTAYIGQISDDGFVLLILNAILIMLGALMLYLFLPKTSSESKKNDKSGNVLEIWKEGLEFINEVPSFRFLTISMILIGVAMNTITYLFLLDVVATYTDVGSIQSFYSVFKIINVGGVLLLQTGISAWLLNRIGFKSIFMFLPAALFISLLAALLVPNALSSTVLITGAIIGLFISNLTMVGIDEPARHAFEGFVPDQRRGRVSAFINGILIQLGSIISCGMIGLVVYGVGQGWIGEETGKQIYTILSLICAAGGILAMVHYRKHYDESSFNWRLKRRSRGKSILDDIDF